MIQCLDFLYAKSVPKPKKRSFAQGGVRFSDVFLAILMLFSILAIVLIPHGPKPDMGYSLDFYTLKSLYEVDSMIAYVGSVPVNMFFMLFKIMLLALTAYGALRIVKNKKKIPVIIMLLCLIFAVNTYDNFMNYTSIRRVKTSDFSEAFYLEPTASHLEFALCKEGRQHSYAMIDALLSLNDYLADLDGTVIVFLPTEYSSYVDTYLDTKAFPITPGELFNMALSNDNRVRMDAQPLTEGNRYLSLKLGLNTWKRNIYSADYIITLAYDNPFAQVEIEHISLPFVILKNVDPDMVYIQSF